MHKSRIIDVAFYNPSLSPRQVRILTAWERERRVIVSFADVRAEVGASAAPALARDLVRKGALQRVRPGRYVVRPFRALGRPTTISTPVTVEALLRDEPHYLGGLWALSFHQLTEQRYDSVLNAFVTHRLQARTIGPARVRFHVLELRAFTYGIERTTIEGVTVPVSDAERTLLDAFDHPRAFFSVARALELLKSQRHRLDLHRLLAHAIAGSKPSTCQRVGMLLERARLPPRPLAKLRARAMETSSLLSMNPDEARSGHVNHRWNVVENDA
jgi:predicted transcriptional regulator of viral defense system